MRIIVFAALLVMNVSSIACSFDVDCQPGSKCIKGQGQIYGICAGGISPGNRNDRQPVTAPLDVNRTYGNTCSFDMDCGIGSKCYKSSNAIDGVCVGERR